MKTIFTALFLFLFAYTAAAQVENAGRKDKYLGMPKYYQDFLNYSSDTPGKTRLDVIIQVPYTQIQFVKSGEGFIANYTITVSIFDEDKNNLLVEKTWNEKVETKDYDQTISKNNFNIGLRSFGLVPGKYLIRTEVEDRDSKKSTSSENAFHVRDMNGSTRVSDLMLIAHMSVENGKNKIIPNVSRNVASQKEGIPFYFEIYSDTGKMVTLNYIILDKNDDEVIKETERRRLVPGKNQVFYTIKDSSLSLGSYVLKINIKDSNDDLLASTGKQFISRWIGIPTTVADLDVAVEQLIYIATPDELDKIENASTKEEKIKAFLEFWKTKDPTPNTEENEIFNEYYRRVAYANESFSHYQKGWRTDRGMVFIILGPPNNVDRHPFDYDSKPYEIWEYYDLNKRFIFLDETGFGDYRLITPLYGDDYRFRN